MSQNDLFNTLLRPAVLHILRAAGFHSAKPSVIDTMVDLTSRYLFLLASRTAYNAFSNHNDPTPDITDVRMAFQDCGILSPRLTGSEEIWKEMLRKPLDDYEAQGGMELRRKKEEERDKEDTKDVRDFLDWICGNVNKEIMRVAGLQKSGFNQISQTEALDAVEMEDYLTSLMKKHSKTGVEARFQGTVLGHPNEPHQIRIEGGPADSIEEWSRKAKERAIKAAE
ncbi:hypothetical protein BDV96DRAFT_465856, partial [Lophiotrema nucula]